MRNLKEKSQDVSRVRAIEKKNTYAFVKRDLDEVKETKVRIGNLFREVLGRDHRKSFAKKLDEHGLVSLNKLRDDITSIIEKAKRSLLTFSTSQQVDYKSSNKTKIQIESALNAINNSIAKKTRLCLTEVGVL